MQTVSLQLYDQFAAFVNREIWLKMTSTLMLGETWALIIGHGSRLVRRLYVREMSFRFGKSEREERTRVPMVSIVLWSRYSCSNPLSPSNKPS